MKAGFHTAAVRPTLGQMKTWIKRRSGTVAQRAGALDGLNLFFGALLGANLGTLDGLRLVDYVKVITILAGTVMALRMVSTAEGRRYVLALLVIYGFLLIGLISVPAMQPRGINSGDLHRLAATLAVWVVFALAIELMPQRAHQSNEDLR